MAALSVRAVAVATGVPVTFALLAVLLAAGSVGAQASAPATGTPAASTPVDSTPVASASPIADPTSSAWFVRRDLVRSGMVPLPVDYRVRTKDPVVFITVDDGVTKDRGALRYVEAGQLPVTAFVTTWTIKDQAAYFSRITRWGSIQNHSATHASLARGTTSLDHEICYSQRALATAFGARSWLMRPPYGIGATRDLVQVTASRCGIDRLVLWNAVVEEGRVSRAGGVLRRGDIVLLHFSPDLEKDLRATVRAARDAGLTPASLADYLPDSSARS